MPEFGAQRNNDLNWCIDNINALLAGGACCLDLGSPYLSGNEDFGLITDPLDSFEGTYDLGGV